MKCKYCDREALKTKDVCPNCHMKLPVAMKFVKECEKFKKRVGYYQLGGENK